MLRSRLTLITLILGIAYLIRNQKARKKLVAEFQQMAQPAGKPQV